MAQATKPTKPEAGQNPDANPHYGANEHNEEGLRVCGSGFIFEETQL
jgi:hypothetical protein